LNPYNGFDPAQRYRALGFVRRQRAKGLLPVPTLCMACGQTEGHVELHSEDYSEPFAANIGAFHLCYRCHMLVHCRIKNPQAFEHYRDLVARGALFAPIRGRSFGVVVAENLNPPYSTPSAFGPPRRDLLGEIARGDYNPHHDPLG